jgi:hypothetical protein
MVSGKTLLVLRERRQTVAFLLLETIDALPKVFLPMEEWIFGFETPRVLCSTTTIGICCLVVVEDNSTSCSVKAP